MAHLASFRVGWENEHLANYLLSRIAFLANPITIGDDIGADTVCTLFEPKEIDGRAQLFPRRSFALQVKSNRRRINATGKIDFLNGLQLPYLLGIVDRTDSSLALYSGQFMPIMFTWYGIPKKLTLTPVEDEEMPVGDAITSRAKAQTLKLPFLIRLCLEDSVTDCNEKRKIIDTRCTRMHKNIAARTCQQYVYHLDDTGGVQMQAGPGSVQTFRDNFYRKLAEVFYNFTWLFDQQPNEFSRSEFEIYNNLYQQLVGERAALPDILHTRYQEILERVDS